MSIPVFPTLFKLTSKKQKSEWNIKIEPKDDGSFTIITSHGIENGKKVIHEKNITEGKVKRSILEQTIQDAKKKWEDKKNKELYSETFDSIINDNEIIVRPMLANKFSFDLYESKSKAFKIPFPAYIQKKYDGIRCIAYMKDNEVILESRKGLKFQNFKLLKEELKELFSKLPPNFYLDGELYTDKLDFETISGLIRQHEKKCSIEDLKLIDMIEFHIYDFVNLNELNIIYQDRYEILNNILSKDGNRCKIVETLLINELKDVKKYHDEYVQNGYEGIIVRDKSGIYEINKRSKYLQKFKEFMDEEFKIIGFHEGTGDEKGLVIWDCITKDEKTFAVRPKGTFESRNKLFLEANLHIGKLLTVIFQEYSNDGIPRFPIGKGIREII
jgi:hypothetical protein